MGRGKEKTRNGFGRWEDMGALGQGVAWREGPCVNDSEKDASCGKTAGAINKVQQ